MRMRDHKACGAHMGCKPLMSLGFAPPCGSVRTRDETVCSIMPYKSLKKRREKTRERKKDNPEKVKAQKQ